MDIAGHTQILMEAVAAIKRSMRSSVDRRKLGYVEGRKIQLREGVGCLFMLQNFQVYSLLEQYSLFQNDLLYSPLENNKELMH